MQPIAERCPACGYMLHPETAHCLLCGYEPNRFSDEKIEEVLKSQG